MTDHAALWTIFLTGVPFILIFDLLLLQRQGAHVTTLREASLWTVFWVVLALAFNVAVYLKLGHERALEFLTAYLIEESLSLDNMFVFIMIFSYFAVPALHQRRILHWGILGAIVMRVIFIFAGVALLEKFHWMLYIFGLILVATGVRMATGRDEKLEPERNFLLRACKKIMPFVNRHAGPEFLVRKDSRWHATPAFATLLVIAASDLVFAVDSIPAVLAVSSDFFIVATSNVFAVLGLRALFFLVSGLIGMFRFLKAGIAAILTFVGVKMLIAGVYKISILASLGVVGALVAGSILASVLFPKRA